MDGYEVARAPRGDPALAAMRLVALTGHGDSEARKEATLAGFDAHVVKPVTADALHAIIEGLIQRG
jgi:CheY-like chemotaxis protein